MMFLHVFSVSCLLLLSVFAQPAHALRQVDFLAEMGVGKSERIAVDDEGERLFVFGGGDEVRILSSTGEELLRIGGKSKKGGTLTKRPVDVAVAKDQILVLDEDLCAVVSFSEDGEYLGSFGSKGDGPGELRNPSAMVIFQDIVYVADTGNNRVEIFSLDGVYLGRSGRKGKDSEKLEKPVDIAIDSQRNLVILDARDNTVRIFDRHGEFVGKFNSLKEPVAIALDAEGIYVLDEERMRVSKHGYDGKELFSFGSKGKGVGQFAEVSDLALDSRGHLYVVDPKKNVVHKFHPEVDLKGLTVPQISPPTSVSAEGYLRDVVADRIVVGKSGTIYAINVKEKAVRVVRDREVKQVLQIPKVEPVTVAEMPDGRLLLLDGNKKRVLQLNTEYRVESEFGSSGSGDGGFSRPTDMVVTDSGIILVSDASNDRVQAFSANGTFLKKLERRGDKEIFDDPVAMDLDGNGRLYVLDAGSKEVLVFDQDLEPVAKIAGEGERKYFDRPVDLAVSADELFVLEAERNTVKVFDPSGNPVRSFGIAAREGVDAPVSLALVNGTSLLVSGEKSRSVSRYLMRYTPEAPQNLRGIPGMRSTRLLWDQATASYVDSYAVMRAEAKGGTFSQIATVSATSYVDKGLKPGSKYLYQVIALARGGNPSLPAPAVEVVPERAKVDAITGVEIVPFEWSVNLTWQSKEPEFLKYYRVYQDQNGSWIPVAEVTDPEAVVAGLEADAEYRFAVAAVSVDQVESDKTEIAVRTLVATRKPLDVLDPNLRDIFSNNYKMYEKNGLGTILLVNNTRNTIASVTVAFQLKDFMDYPWETTVTDLKPLEEREVVLKAVFNNRILEVTEDTPVQAEIRTSYYRNQELLSYSSSHTLNVYEKHKMLWSEEGMFASFITPKDPVILDFVRSLVTQYQEFSAPLIHAAIAFESLGAAGLTYLPDPGNPYQEASGKVDTVDYVQYPRETLKRKSGDCDDLVGLYATALESLGIQTRAVAVPGHMFMIFSTGIDADRAAPATAGTFVIHDDKLWVPVEVTVVGQPFMTAWASGVRNYTQWDGKGLTILDFRDAWITYKPANLPSFGWSAERLERALVEKKYPESVRLMSRILLQNTTHVYLARVQKDAGDVDAHIQLGIIYAQANEFDQGEKHFLAALELDPASAAVMNGLGNVHYLRESYGEAVENYAKASELDPGDADILINLARACLEQKEVFKRQKDSEGESDMTAKAKDAYAKAVALDPGVSTRYRGLAFRMMSTF